jgi:hypothetical protein
MAYATADQLAEALRTKVTAANQQLLDDCLAAAATEIDSELTGPVAPPVPELVSRTNVNRAVEWYKAADAAYGMVGFEQVGVIQAPRDGFNRHAAALLPLKTSWGVA